MRLAFGTEFRLPDPMRFLGDADLLRPRWQSQPEGSFVAGIDGEVVGTVTIVDWGSVSVLGPLGIRPDYWNRGIARQLMPAALAVSEARGARPMVLFTDPASPRHLRLYEASGFTSQNLIAVTSRGVRGAADDMMPLLFSQLASSARDEALMACRGVTNAIFDGLDLSREIHATVDQRLGETILLRDRDELAGFAICHMGPGTDAGSGVLAIKFAGVRPRATSSFEKLLTVVETLAAMRGLQRVQAAANHARRVSYDVLKECGYRAEIMGVAMRRPASPGYDDPDILALDEWR